VLGITVQLLCVAGLLLCAILVQRSLRNGRLQSWENVMKHLTSCDQHLLQLSYHPIFSAGLECPSDQLWAAMDGINGCMAIFNNAGVLLDALEFIYRDGPCSEALSRAIRLLRANAVRLRALIVAELVRRALMSLIRMNPPAPVGVAEAYVMLISQIGLAINDYRPDLLSCFKHYIVTS
jgi:hypothetical protein